jgi:uncharacterized protein (TIGR03083 family)
VAYEWIIDALDETWSSIDRVVRPQSAAAYDAPTPCPGWSVRDVLSHLLGFETHAAGRPGTQFRGALAELRAQPHRRGQRGLRRAHRGEAGIEVLDRFCEVTADSLASLRALDAAAWEKVGWSPEGERPYHRFQETRVLDSWIHLQDIRDALLEPADDHGVGEEIVVNRFEAALPYVVGKKLQPPEGTLIQVNLTGVWRARSCSAWRTGRAEALECERRRADL